MLCSPEQIEAKRRKALEKLRAKLNNSNNATSISVSNSKTVSSPSTVSNSKTVSSPSILSNSKTVSSPITILQNNKYENRNIVTKVLFNKNINNESSKQFDKTTFTPYARTARNEYTFSNSNVVRGSACLVTGKRFGITTEKYSEHLNILFRKMSTKSWDVNTKLWTFDIKEYDILMNHLKLLRPDISINTIPDCVVNLVKENEKQEQINKMKQIDLTTIDPELLNSLMKFQLDGVQFGIQKRGRCLIADEMGLGKTFQALAIACYYRNDWPLLIVTTASTKNAWQETIGTYIPSVPLMHVKYMSTSTDYINDSKIVILSYDLMSRTIDKLLTMQFRTLILDESHTLKNFKTKCTKAAYNLSKQAKRVILLSGTPAVSRPSELYTQIQLIDDKFFKDFKEYSIRYCQGHNSRFGWDSSGQSNLQELELVLNLKFMIRRTKDQVLPFLPTKTRELIMLDQELINCASESDLKRLNSLRHDFNETKSDDTNRSSILLVYFNLTAKLKRPAVCKYLIDELKKDGNHRKLLIFAHHQVMLDSICEVFEENGIPFMRIDGRTPIAHRTLYVNKFNTSDEYRCAVLSIKATNAGITLTAASLVIFAELHWNPSILVQAEGRAHRIGQDNAVQVRYLLANNTADDDMWNIIKSKVEVLNGAGLSKDSFDDAIVKQQECASSQSQSKTIDQFFEKQTPIKSDNIENISIDDFQNTVDPDLMDFINDDDDDILASVQI